ncbi:hypothetical protein Tco_0214706 [Tanacetum coccineum]
MQTRSSSKFVGEPSTNPTSTISKRRNRRRSIQRVEPLNVLWWNYSVHPPRVMQRTLRACPHHGFTQLHQLDTFYNGLNPSDQDSLNSAAGGNLLERSAQDVLKIIENKSKVRNSRSKPIVSQVKASNVDSLEIASTVASAVTSAMTAMFKQHQVTPTLSSVKAVEESCVTCGGAHSYRQCPATDGNTFLGYQDNIQGYVSAAASINRINVIDVACGEYAQKVLGFSDSSTSGNPTPSLDPILSTSSPSLTPIEEGDFILEEIEAVLYLIQFIRD